MASGRGGGRQTIQRPAAPPRTGRHMAPVRNPCLLWALGVEGQGHMAEILDVEGGGLSGDRLPLSARLTLQGARALLLRLLGGRPDHRAVLVQLVLQLLDQFVLLIQL